MKDGIISSLPGNRGSCVEYAKRKLTKTKRKDSIQSQKISSFNTESESPEYHSH